MSPDYAGMLAGPGLTDVGTFNWQWDHMLYPVCLYLLRVDIPNRPGGLMAGDGVKHK